MISNITCVRCEEDFHPENKRIVTCPHCHKKTPNPSFEPEPEPEAEPEIFSPLNFDNLNFSKTKIYGIKTFEKIFEKQEELFEKQEEIIINYPFDSMNKKIIKWYF